VNLHVLETYLRRLGLSEITNVCVNGQLAIDLCQEIIDEAISESNELI